MQRAGFSFLACPDPEIVRERVERQLADSGQPFSREVFWGDEELGAPFWSALTVGSLFAGRRAVILRRADACLKTQRLIGKHFYRPSDAEVAKEFADKYAQVKLFTIDEVSGGWTKTQQEHFADGGIYDQIFANARK